MKIIQNLTIDIMDNHIYEMVYSKQYDNSRQARFTITKNGIAYDLTGLTASFELKKPDKTFVKIDNCTIENNVVIVDIDEQMTYFYGNIPFQVKLLKGTETVTSVTGFLRVEESVIQDDDVKSTIEYETLTELIEQYTELLNSDIVIKRDEFEETVSELDTKIRNTEKNANVYTDSQVVILNNKITESDSSIITNEDIDTMFS